MASRKKESKFPFLLVLLLARLFLITKPLKNTSGLPRSIRNNNPGNIKISGSPWKGKVPLKENTDGTFEQFITKIWGIRALIKLMQTYMNTLKLTTIKEIITRYAPGQENPTRGYIDFVSTRVGMSPTQEITTTDQLKGVVVAISEFESGIDNVIKKNELDAAFQLI